MAVARRVADRYRALERETTWKLDLPAVLLIVASLVASQPVNWALWGLGVALIVVNYVRALARLRAKDEAK